MPIYTYECDCGDLKEEFRHVSGRHDAPQCDCGGKMSLKITPTMLQPVLGGGDFPGYQCVVTDEYITSRKRRREIMKEYNLVEKDRSKPLKQTGEHQ